MSARTPAIGTVLRLSKAHDLIRLGQLKAARAMISPDGRPPEDDTELHTFAALATREGEYGQALALWRLLLQRQPRHPEASRMISAIEIWQGRPDWHRYVPVGGAVFGVLLLVVAAIAMFSSPPKSPSSAASPSTPAPVSAAPNAQGSVASPAAVRTPTPAPKPTGASGIQFSVQPAGSKSKAKNTR